MHPRMSPDPKHFRVVETKDGLWFYLSPFDVVEVSYRTILAGEEVTGSRFQTAWTVGKGQGVRIESDSETFCWRFSGRVIF